MSSVVKSSHSSERMKYGPASWRRASAVASARLPAASRRRSRHGSTGWLSGTGCRHGRDAASDAGGAPPAATASAAGARVTRCVTPTIDASARLMPIG
eukprot:355366-Chlamydomonas_euryale.AAC.4